MSAPLIPLRFDGWAVRRLLEACRPLTAEELGRPFDIGWGSVRQTFLHVISSEMYWTDRLLARGERDLPEDGPRDESVDALLALHATVHAELYAVAQRLVDQGKLEAPVRLLYAEYQAREVRAATVLAPRGQPRRPPPRAAAVHAPADGPSARRGLRSDRVGTGGGAVKTVHLTKPNGCGWRSRRA